MSSAKRTIRILSVEDSPDDFELVRHALSSAVPAELTRVEDEPGMAAALARAEWDLVISDHHLPRFSSGAALALLRRSQPETPFIIVTGAVGEETAIQAMLSGADDYVMKSNLARLPGAVERALRLGQERRAKRMAQDSERQALEALRLSRQRVAELSAHAERIDEQQRVELSREIHDEMGGLVTRLKADVAWLRMHTAGDETATAKLRDVESLLDDVVAVSERLRAMYAATLSFSDEPG